MRLVSDVLGGELNDPFVLNKVLWFVAEFSADKGTRVVGNEFPNSWIVVR